VFQEREEIDRVYTFLSILDSSYEAIRTQILLSTENLIFDGVIALIRQEASRRVVMGAPDSNPNSEAHTFTTHRFSTGQSKAKGEVQRCHHCEKEEHVQDRC
jgi:hypothetical protein